MIVWRWLNSSCLVLILTIFIGFICLFQCFVGIFFLFIQTDFSMLNKLIEIDRFDSSFLFYILYNFIGLGFISMILSSISIYVTIRHKKSLAFFLAVLWIFVMALNLIMLCLLIVYQTMIFPKFDRSLIRLLNEYPLKTSNSLDYFQEKYSCCGIWTKNDYENLPLDPFPSSCCRLPNCWRDAQIDSFAVSLIHSNGCYSSIVKFLRIELIVLIVVSTICFVFDLIVVFRMFSMSNEQSNQ